MDGKMSGGAVAVIVIIILCLFVYVFNGNQIIASAILLILFIAAAIRGLTKRK